MTNFDAVLDDIRGRALDQFAKGKAFERLIQKWLMADPVQARRFQYVQSGEEWRVERGLQKQDIGTDLIGTLKDGGCVAIQAKLYEKSSITKKDLDSFIADTGKIDPKTGQNLFEERLFIETSGTSWSKNLKETIKNIDPPFHRIGLHDLRVSHVDWSAYLTKQTMTSRVPRELRAHQIEAHKKVMSGFKNTDRGKLIMACGTGKTLTGLRIAESLTKMQGRVLVLVPSLSLMSQTIRSWAEDSQANDLRAYAVCSDSQVGKKSNNDEFEIETSDLQIPASTNAEKLAHALNVTPGDSFRVVFATYQSISAIEQAQKEYGVASFDLILADEAHRTTGVTLKDEDDSHFVKVHNKTIIEATKRLYMTATPRIYTENVKGKADDIEATVASMDDEATFGPLFHHYSFPEAVEQGILSDYRVIVLTVDEGEIANKLPKELEEDRDHTLKLEDATKIVGCWKALNKIDLKLTEKEASAPMQTALAFCNSIDNSKLMKSYFHEVVQSFQEQTSDEETTVITRDYEVDHVDGTQGARLRQEKLDWLRSASESGKCRILSNAKCLTEGVDVPSLDAILFLHPRKSQVDVIQAVGRVMRKAEGKDMGYVILPVGIPPNMAAIDVLNQNERFRVVWQILNALRAHDENLDNEINQGGLGQNIGHRIAIVDGRPDRFLKDVTAEVDTLPSSTTTPLLNGGGGREPSDNGVLSVEINDLSQAIMAKLVEKCGTRDYWEDWAKDVAEIAERHVTRITALVHQEGTNAAAFFQDFLKELRINLNASLSEKDAIEMLAQHLITRPVFEAIFEGDHAFIKQNPVSAAMEEILSVIDETNIHQEAETLTKFYASVKRRATGVTDPNAKQQLIVELYDKFFSTAFKDTASKLGIVYTPTDIVDFIIHSVNDILQDEFGQTLGSKNVHILDPFTGTGTFITRLLQSGLIPKEDLERKYRDEIWSNEIVLLAYYIAAINIETVFHGLHPSEDYMEFPGICLTDTFAMNKAQKDFSFDYMPHNSERSQRQNRQDVRVILGNPPWRVGKKDHKYVALFKRITETYARKSPAANKNGLYDSYKLAIRWASDRIGEQGVIGFVTNGSWLNGNMDAGIRACLNEEYTSVHAINLRGHILKFDKKEGGNVFDVKVGPSIIILTKNPAKQDEKCYIQYHDIGDYLKKEEKLAKLKSAKSINGIKDWQDIRPDERHDWIAKQEKGFEYLFPLGSKEVKAGKADNAIFKLYSRGYETTRDTYLYNFSHKECERNAQLMIKDYQTALQELGDSPTKDDAKIAALKHSNNIKWNDSLQDKLRRRIDIEFCSDHVKEAHYRPFQKQFCYADDKIAHRPAAQNLMFPAGNIASYPPPIGLSAYLGSAL